MDFEDAYEQVLIDRLEELGYDDLDLSVEQMEEQLELIGIDLDELVEEATDRVEDLNNAFIDSPLESPIDSPIASPRAVMGIIGTFTPPNIPGAPQPQIGAPPIPVIPGVILPTTRAPVVPTVQTRAPVVPTVQTRAPVVPTVQTRAPVVPTVQTRAPVVPTVQTRAPVVPTVQTRAPIIQARTPTVQIRTPVPAMQTRAPIVPTIQTRAPIVPTVQIRTPVVQARTPVVQARTPVVVKPLATPLKFKIHPVMSPKKPQVAPVAVVATPARPVLPTVATPARPVLPTVATPARPVLPTVATPARPVLPTVATPARPVLPTVATPARPVLPTVATPARPVLPTVATPARPVLPTVATPVVAISPRRPTSPRVTVPTTKPAVVQEPALPISPRAKATVVAGYTREQLNGMTVVRIKQLYRDAGLAFGGAKKKAELIERYLNLAQDLAPTTPQTATTNNLTADQLGRMKVKDIRATLRQRGIRPRGATTKKALISRYLEATGQLTTATIDTPMTPTAVTPTPALPTVGNVQKRYTTTVPVVISPRAQPTPVIPGAMTPRVQPTPVIPGAMTPKATTTTPKPKIPTIPKVVGPKMKTPIIKPKFGVLATPFNPVTRPTIQAPLRPNLPEKLVITEMGANVPQSRADIDAYVNPLIVKNLPTIQSENTVRNFGNIRSNSMLKLSDTEYSRLQLEATNSLFGQPLYDIPYVSKDLKTSTVGNTRRIMENQCPAEDLTTLTREIINYPLLDINCSERLFSLTYPQLREIVQSMGYIGFEGTMYDCMILYQLSNLYSGYQMTLTPDQVAIVCSSSHRNLGKFLRSKIRGDLRRIGVEYLDKATMVFMITHGMRLNSRNRSIVSGPIYLRQRTYPMLRTPLQDSLRAMKYIYDINPMMTGIHVKSYAFITSTNAVEPIIINYRGDYNATALELGMIYPPNLREDQKENYMLTYAQEYGYIPLRNPDMIQIPDLEGRTQRDAIRILRQFSDQDIWEQLGLEGMINNWDNRPSFLRQAAREAIQEKRWFFLEDNCKNDDRLHGIMFEPREKGNPQDPIISYGKPRNYRCYQTSELEMSFREYKGTFKFQVPDWTTGDTFDRYFSRESMVQLRTILVEANNPVFEPLINKITEGLALAHDPLAYALRLRREYEALPEADKPGVDRYIAWIFRSGMRMRHWKGPGNKYPTKFREGGRGEERCGDARRERNVMNKMGERTILLERVSTETEQWLLNFDIIEYNFGNNQAIVGGDKLDTVTQRLMLGQFCLSHGSDIFLQTGFFIAKGALGLDLNGFNDFIQADIQISNPGKVQPPFNPAEMTRTGHTDPGLGYVLQDRIERRRREAGLQRNPRTRT